MWDPWRKEDRGRFKCSLCGTEQTGTAMIRGTGRDETIVCEDCCLRATQVPNRPAAPDREKK